MDVFVQKAIALIVLIAPTLAYASVEVQPETLRTAYERVSLIAANDPGFEQFRARVESIGQMGDRIITSLDAHQAMLLDKILGLSVPADKRASGRAPRPANAAEILADYQDQFARVLPKPQVADSDFRVLQQYHAVVVEAVEDRVFERGRVVSAMEGGTSGEAARFGLVVAFLHATDAEWSLKHVSALPGWMRRPSALANAETFALSVHRPLTAYHLFLTSSQSSRAPASHDEALTSYLTGAAERLVRAHDLQGALTCLGSGIAAAEGASRFDESASLRLIRASLLVDAGHVQPAADDAKWVLDCPSAGEHHGRAAMLRLKYLYSAERLTEVVSEATELWNDDKCVEHLPQIMFLTWAAQRRLNQTKHAAATEQRVLARFPDHPLSADIRVAAAMSALTDGRHEEGMMQLEIIAHRHSSSRHMRTVKEMQERLRQLLIHKQAE